MALQVDTSEYDKSRAFRIDLAVKELNAAIVEAHGAGLRVEVNHITHQNIGERWQRQMFSADVTRKIEAS